MKYHTQARFNGDNVRFSINVDTDYEMSTASKLALVDHVCAYFGEEKKSPNEEDVELIHLVKRDVMILMKNNKVMLRRDLERQLNTSRYGLSKWNIVIQDLVSEGRIAESGTGEKNDPKIFRLTEEV